ncbi:hypothetical protein GYB61_09175 [bacterium]|nr:hypothetical protein [bacterium]
MQVATFTRALLLPCLLVGGCANTAQQLPALLPSEATLLINRALDQQADAPRRSITGPYVRRIDATVESASEKFYQGEIAFLDFRPDAAFEAFTQAASGDSDIARVANQRLLIIRVNAYEQYDAVVKEHAPAYRQRFPIRPDDRYGISYPLLQVAAHYFRSGRGDEALDIIRKEVMAHDAFEAPYLAYSLPLRAMAHAKDAAQRTALLELAGWAKDGLDLAIEARLKQSNWQPPAGPSVAAPVRGTLLEDQTLGGHQWTAEFMQLRDRIAQMLDRATAASA